MAIKFDIPTIRIRGTRFQFYTHFSGDPAEDKFGSTEHYGNVIIPDKKLAKSLIKEGFNVKETRPKDDQDPKTFVPEYFVRIKAGYKGWSEPSIYLFDVNGKPTKLSEKSIGTIDRLARQHQVADVDVVLNKYQRDSSTSPTLYIESMKVTRSASTDPYSEEYETYWSEHKKENVQEDKDFDALADDEDVPF